MPVNPETGKIPHGTNGGYTNWECRCDKCRRAHADAKKYRKVVMNQMYCSVCGAYHVGLHNCPGPQP